jgi:hypothetical protein
MVDLVEQPDEAVIGRFNAFQRLLGDWLFSVERMESP